MNVQDFFFAFFPQHAASCQLEVTRYVTSSPNPNEEKPCKTKELQSAKETDSKELRSSCRCLGHRGHAIIVFPAAVRQRGPTALLPLSSRSPCKASAPVPPGPPCRHVMPTGAGLIALASRDRSHTVEDIHFRDTRSEKWTKRGPVLHGCHPAVFFPLQSTFLIEFWKTPPFQGPVLRRNLLLQCFLTTVCLSRSCLDKMSCSFLATF